MFEFFNKMFFTSNKVKAQNNVKRNTAGTFNYLFNDPSTPDLKGIVDIPKWNKPNAGFNVRDINARGERGRMAMQTYTALAITANYVQRKLEKKFNRWAATRALAVYPEAGRQFNAYYDRRSLRFFWDYDKVMKKNVYTADSVDIVAHELGHAILDAIRPDFWNMQAIEIWSFHESWADIVAILGIMQQDAVIEYALNETNGNMNKSNVISKLAEEMGEAIYNFTKGRGGRKRGELRNAINDFMYVTPEKLPSNAPHNKLAAECHSFGRVFLGAWYEIMVNIYNQNKSKMDNKKALIKARDVSAYLFLNAIRHAPANARFYNGFARAMIFVDKANGNKYNKILNDVFKSRKLLRHRVKALSNVKFEDIKLNKNDRVLSGKNKDIKAVVKSENKVMKLSDHFGLRAQGNNPLYDAEIEVPSETYMEFNEEGNIVDEVKVSERQTINAARECIKYLHKENMVGDESMFNIENGKLVRKYIE